MAEYHNQSKLRFWCQMVLPLVYDDSLSYMELLNKVVNYLNNCIQDVGNCETNIESLLEAFVNLQNYVNEIVEDISPEIESKIDEMIENGDFADILTDVLNTVVAHEYNPETSYLTGEYCLYDGDLYRATANTTGTFDPTKWEERTVCYDLTLLQRYVYGELTENAEKFIYGIEIPANSDLDTYLTPGNYFCTGTNSSSVSNTATSGFFFLKVENYSPTVDGNRSKQIFMTRTEMYIRHRDGAGWKPWQKFVFHDEVYQNNSFFAGKKALIIGDSYNKGNAWGGYFKTITGMGDNVTSIQQNGGGFGRVAGTGADYEGEYYYQAIQHISADIEFDYIIAQAGRNDAYSPEDSTGTILVNGINQFISVCKSRWANANIYIFPTNNDSPVDDAHEKYYDLIVKTALQNGVYVSGQSSKWFYDTGLNSDAAHLTAAGNEMLAQYIAACICGWNGVLKKQEYDHKNLLTNSIFSRFLINSRKITTASAGSSNVKIIDGWVVGRGSVTVNTNSISVVWNGTDGTNGYIAQHHIPINNYSHFTLSAIIDNELYWKSFIINDNQTDYDYLIKNNTVRLRITKHAGNEASITIYNYSTTAITINAVKLEYGNQQTLATDYEGHIVIIDGSSYAEEIAKCRTLVIPIFAYEGVSSGQRYCGIRGYSSATSVLYQIDEVKKMVANPSIEYNFTHTNACVDSTGASANITGASAAGKQGIEFTVASNLAAGTIAIYLNDFIFLTCE